jgi:hypothetical protein
LSPQEVKTVDRCLSTIEEEAKETEPSGAVIKSMTEKLVKGIEAATQAAGLVKAGKALWEFCQHLV